jgi:hypothetical protein
MPARGVHLDVREPYEYQIAQIGGKLIPQNDVPQRLAEIDRNREVVVHCRAAAVAALAAHRGVRVAKQPGYPRSTRRSSTSPAASASLGRRDRPEGAEVLKRRNAGAAAGLLGNLRIHLRFGRGIQRSIFAACGDAAG